MAKNRIFINNLSGIEIDKKYVRKIVSESLKLEKIKDKEVSIVFLENKEIRRLNREYRKLDRTTDVLSFPEDKENSFLGEIAIAPEAVKERSEEGFEKGLARVLVHGALHLMGYDHIDKKDREEMRKREEKMANSKTK